MKRNMVIGILFLFVFSAVTAHLLHPYPPKECPSCWQQFKSSKTTIILPVEKTDDNTHLISLKNLKAELEKQMLFDSVDMENAAAEYEISGTVLSFVQDAGENNGVHIHEVVFNRGKE